MPSSCDGCCAGCSSGQVCCSFGRLGVGGARVGRPLGCKDVRRCQRVRDVCIPIYTYIHTQTKTITYIWIFRSICLSTYLQPYPSVFLTIYPFTKLRVYLAVYISIFLSSAGLAIHLSAYVCMYLSVYPHTCFLSIYLSTRFVHLYMSEFLCFHKHTHTYIYTCLKISL